MSILDVDRLLEPISDDSPCGPNLEYDDTYAEFERAARGTPERQVGDSIKPAELPDWKEVYRLGTELVERTKDLRVACQLARGVLVSRGLPGFADCLALVRGYIDRYWPTIHPQLDPDDNNDPTLRVNTVASLNDHATTIQSLRSAPIVTLRGLGSFSLRELEIAKGEIPHVGDDEPPKLETIEAAFAECPLDELKANTDAICSCLEHVEAIDSKLTEYVGSSHAISPEDLRATLLELRQILNTRLARRDPSVMVEEGNGQPLDESLAVGNQPSVRATGDIRSREDVVAALDRICQYYNRYEPSSPLPLLLSRAKRLASKSFLEIVKDLTPEAVSQIQKLSGLSEDGDAD